MKKVSLVVALLAFLGSTLSLSSAQAAGVPTVVADPVESTAYGRTVDAASGHRVPFVLVIAFEADYSTIIGATVSNRRGRFVLRGLTDEEFALRYVGRLTRHEAGWQACDRTVVPTSGEACTQGPGAQGRIRLDRW